VWLAVTGQGEVTRASKEMQDNRMGKPFTELEKALGNVILVQEQWLSQ
jgi:hypothetical protein